MTRQARFSVTLAPSENELIRRAAKLSGVSLAAYARETLVIASEQIVATSKDITLAKSEIRRILQAHNGPFKPNTRLARAIRKRH